MEMKLMDFLLRKQIRGIVIDAGHPRFYKPSVVMSCSK